LEARIAEYVTAEAQKVDRVAAVLASFDAVAANAKTEIERLRARQQSAEKAAQRLEAALVRDPQLASAENQLGYEYAYLGRWDEA